MTHEARKQKSARKLSLNRETVRNLTDTELDGVVGGAADLSKLNCDKTETCLGPIGPTGFKP